MAYESSPDFNVWVIVYACQMTDKSTVRRHFGSKQDFKMSKLPLSRAEMQYRKLFHLRKTHWKKLLRI